MPNRILKESICTSGNLNQLSPQEEVFFYRLIVICDDFGLADARPQILRSKCFPLKVDAVKEKDMEAWLAALVKAELCFLYEVDGKRYLKMTTWDGHQQRRAVKPKFPPPEGNGYHLISPDSKPPRESGPKPKPKEKPGATVKKQYGEFVQLTEGEYDRLLKDNGEDLPQMIAILDSYLGQNEKNLKRYTSHYHVLMPAGWVKQRLIEEKAKVTPLKRGGNKFQTPVSEGSSPAAIMSSKKNEFYVPPEVLEELAGR